MSSKADQTLFDRKPKTTLLLVTIFLISLLLLVGEFASRILFPEWAPTRAERVNFWTYDAILGWAHQPNQSGTFKHRDFSVSVKINSHGLRDKDYPLTRTEKGRILVMGDSFGWGFGVEHEEIFSEIIERRNHEWEIINASVSGYGTDQQYLHLISKGISFRPDVIFLLFYGNDFNENANSEAYWYYKPMFVLENDELILTNNPVPPSSLEQLMKRFILGHTYLLSKLSRALYRIPKLIMTSLTDPTQGSGLSAANDGRDTEARLDRYEVTRRLLLRMDEQARQIQARFVIVSVPMGEEKRQILKSFTEKHDISYLALDETFSKVTETVTFANDEHWNPTGHRVAADAIESFLKQQGLLH